MIVLNPGWKLGIVVKAEFVLLLLKNVYSLSNLQLQTWSLLLITFNFTNLQTREYALHVTLSYLQLTCFKLASL